MKERHPDRSYADCVKAIAQYKLFLELKQEHNEYQSEKFSPSIAIDEVWHAHLSMLDRCQKDVQAMTKTNKIFEHNPVLGSASREHYAAAQEAHATRMQKLGEKVDIRFWPTETPREVGEDHDGDSYDGLYLPYSASCG